MFLFVSLQLLKFPDMVTNLDFKHVRDAHLDLQLVADLESLVVQWSNALESVLIEGAQDRYLSLFLQLSNKIHPLSHSLFVFIMRSKTKAVENKCE